MSGRARTLAVAAGAAVLLVGSTPTAAHAGETGRESTRAETETAGYALAQLTVNFPSRRSFDVKGWVRDVCNGEPGDGRGAYAYVVFTPRGGETRQRFLGSDTNGCGKAKRYFDPAPVRASRRIRSITLMVCETDADQEHDGLCFLRRFDNWRVG